MSTHKETRLVHCYDPVAFVIAVEQGVKDGFSLDLVTPEHYPQQIGWQFITTMVRDNVDQDEDTVKSTSEPASETVVQEVSASTAASQVAIDVPKKQGRPTKGK